MAVGVHGQQVGVVIQEALCFFVWIARGVYRCCKFNIVFLDTSTLLPLFILEAYVFLTLTETNIAPENRPGPKGKRSYSNHPFSGAKMLVLGRVSCSFNLHLF